MSLQEPRTDNSEALYGRYLWGMACAVLGLLLFAEFRAVFLRYLVNDDYQILYTTWLSSLGQTAPRDFGVQSYHILPDLLVPFVRLVGDGFRVVFRIRILFLILLALIPWFVMRLGKRLFHPHAGPFAAVLSLGSWPLIERGLDIRPDAILALIWLGLLTLILGRAQNWRKEFGSGALLGFALIVRQKAIVLVPIMLGMLVYQHFRNGRAGMDLRRFGVALGLCCGGAAIVLVFFMLFLVSTGRWEYFVEGNRVLFQLANTTATGGKIRSAVFTDLITRDYYLIPFLVFGLLSTVNAVRRNPTESLPGVLVVVMSVVLFVALNPAFYSYNFIIILPVIAPFLGAGGHALASLPRSRAWQFILSAVLLSSPLIAHGVLLYRLATRQTNAHQVALAAALEQTSADTRFFAMEGIGLFRPSIYDWRLAAISVPLYRQGKIDLGMQLRSTRPEIVILNYRVPAWLLEPEQRWLTDNYVLVAPGLGVLSTRVDPTHPLGFMDVFRAQPFEVVGSPCIVDGVLRKPGNPFTLQAGRHMIQITRGASVVQFSWPGVEAMRRFNSPFITPPDYSYYQD